MDGNCAASKQQGKKPLPCLFGTRMVLVAKRKECGRERLALLRLLCTSIPVPAVHKFEVSRVSHLLKTQHLFSGHVYAAKCG